MYLVEKIGHIIGQRRRELGLTQETLAKKLHISPQAISKWETGNGYPDLALIPSLAETLRLSPDVLFGFDISHSSVPPTYDGLPLICNTNGLALYSEKTITRQEGKIVYFSDGSEADFSSETIVNMGPGEIRFRHVASQEPSDMAYQAAEAEQPLVESFADIHSIHASLSICCNLVLEKGKEGEKTRIEATGSRYFLSRIYITEKDHTLFINTKDGKDIPHGKNNYIHVSCGFSKGKQLRLSINGPSDATVKPDFAAGQILINGSGDVDAVQMDSCEVKINGSGDVTLNAAKEKLTVRINGSGDVSCSEAQDADIQINGSGDVSLEKCSNRLNVQISGSGDVKAGGQVDTLSVKITGSGDLDAAKLTTTDGEFHSTGGCEITVGRILHRSVEKIREDGKLTVLKRG